MYEDFKLYSYGKSDFKQLEFSDSFFQNSMEKRTYKRKNKKRKMPLSKISFDISIPDMGLDEIEKEILPKFIFGWSRNKRHINVNRNFISNKNNDSFSSKYEDAIETCVLDTISTFLYLLYNNFPNNEKSIKKKGDIQTTLNF